MSNFYIPARRPSDWKPLLTKPRRHWKPGHSAKLLAYCWQQADDFPLSVRNVFKYSGIKIFQNIKLLVAFPEWKVPLPGGRRASQSDIFILAKGNDQLISIMVEGKVRESFGEIIADWKLEDYGGKEDRLNYLCELLNLDKELVDPIRYQLLHRTTSAIIEAKNFNARHALMLVHSFSPTNEGFKDYCQFLELFNIEGNSNSIASTGQINGIELHFGWVNESY